MIEIDSFFLNKFSTLTKVIVEDLQANSDYYCLYEDNDYYANINIGPIVGNMNLIIVRVYKGKRAETIWHHQIADIVYLFNLSKYNKKACYKVTRNNNYEKYNDISCYSNTIIQTTLGESIIDKI